ncbi:MAG: hypothetical protein M1830_001044 [Pleopsidium flavum]|nr:MAG: hypothetical protein M1830_001044 [Pleopsidium flavum]
MLPQGLNDTSEAPPEAKKLPISVLAHRATFVEVFRRYGASMTNSSSSLTRDLSQTHANSPTNEACKNASTKDHMVEGNGVTQPTLLEGKWLFPVPSSHDEEDHAEEGSGVNSSPSATGQEVLSGPLSLRRRPRETYPEEINIDLPHDFLAGELRFFEYTPPFLQLPKELRLQILGYLLISVIPITNPYANGHKPPPVKPQAFVDARILCTCQQLCLEGKAMLYQQNIIRFTEKAALDSFRSSPFSNHRKAFRHLELQTTVAEQYCHRTFQVQGQTIRRMRVRGPAEWDWPFSLPWRFIHLHTLKLELTNFHLLPLDPPPRTRHFRPDPQTKEGRDALLTKHDVIEHIAQNSRTPKLKNLTVIGVKEPMCVFRLEFSLFLNVLFDTLIDNHRHMEIVCYLEKRIGGRWETQDEKTKEDWDAFQRLVAAREEELAKSGSNEVGEYSAEVEHNLNLGIVMWIRRMNAQRLGDKAGARKEPVAIW